MNERLLEARVPTKAAGPEEQERQGTVGGAVKRQMRAFHDLSEAVGALKEEVERLKQERLAARAEAGRVLESLGRVEGRLSSQRAASNPKTPFWWFVVGALLSGLVSAGAVLGLLVASRMGWL